jgi:hypothetical protein
MNLMNEESLTLNDKRAIRIICLAAMVWLHEHDYPGYHAEILDSEINKQELAKAIDRITIERR